MMYDVVVLGAGAGGAMASLLLSRKGLTVAIVERAAAEPKKVICPEWISASAVDSLRAAKLDGTACLEQAFSGMTFHSPDFKKTTQALNDKPPAWRVDYGQFVDWLRGQAEAAGIVICAGTACSEVSLGEDRVTLHVGEAEPIEARFLLLSDGAARTFLAANSGSSRLPLAEPPLSGTTGRWIATARVPLAAKAAEADGTMHWVLDRPQHTHVLWWQDGRAIVCRAEGSGTGVEVAAHLHRVVAGASAAGLLPVKAPLEAGDVVLRPAPARSALEIDSHVEKRCLTIGDAGGFTSDASGEGIYPALWSAKIAADCILHAAAGPLPQDRLREFSTTWRTTMAEYLRPPNTDAHFLLPLIFNNKQMAQRMAAAFWRGENI